MVLGGNSSGPGDLAQVRLIASAPVITMFARVSAADLPQMQRLANHDSMADCVSG
jgi:hypothetical protein